MKKLINDPADVVSEALSGMAVAHPELSDTSIRGQRRR